MPDIFTTKSQKNVKKLPDAPIVDSNHLSMVTTLCRNPKNIAISGQDPDENVLLFLRQDFITNAGWMFSTIIFLLLPLLVPTILRISEVNLSFLPSRVTFLISMFYYLLVTGYAFGNYLTWFYTIGVVTNKKAMDIDFQSLSSINVATANLVDTSDAKYMQQGFFQSFFDYGTIILTIEATKEQLIFEKTPQPAMVANLLGDLIGERSK